jgi:cob(I)alamin adenosyltransferase
VDETNAALGAVCAFAGEPLRRLLSGVQRDLFAIGAQLADPTHRVAAKRAKAAVTATHVRRLERAIDAREAKLPPLRSFVLPGGTPAAALLHHARTVCRRAERSVVTLAREADVTEGRRHLNAFDLFRPRPLREPTAGVDEPRW